MAVSIGDKVRLYATDDEMAEMGYNPQKAWVKDMRQREGVVVDRYQLASSPEELAEVVFSGFNRPFTFCDKNLHVMRADNEPRR